MAAELAKTYEPSAVEPLAHRVWMEENCFHAEPSAPGEPYCIVIPPPNVTGALHLGHAINNTLQDILIRQHRMRGFNTLWVPGIDHAGIATQAVVEKQLKEKENKTRHDVGREGLVARIWQWKEQYGNRILEQLKRLGCSCDWQRTRFTLDDICARAVRETFFRLFKDGLIYRGKRLVNWDVYLQTSVSDDEIYHETVNTSLWYVKYPIVGQRPEDRPAHVVVATTRPETMLGDTAVAVHPDDPRWNWAVGMMVRLPLVDRLIPIVADPVLVSMEFGTGCVKVTPAHDQNDYACWQRQGGRIDIINIITPDGRINENGGPYAGLPREEARRRVVEDLRKQGLLLKEEPYQTQIGHSDRSKTPIEPYLSDQWFVKMAPLAEPALEVVRQGFIKFFPERHAQQYLAWLGEKRDWPISRQLWWGHRIPIWSRDVQLPDGSGGDLSDRLVRDALSRLVGRDWDQWTAGGGDYWLRAEPHPQRSGWMRVYVCVREASASLPARLEAAGFVQDPDVLDTWFSSALWPHSTLGWPEDTPELRKWYPTSVLLTGQDIITLWVARMVIMGLYNMGRGAFVSPTEDEARARIAAMRQQVLQCIPFRHVPINPTILDGRGERMSKSKGNGVDPVDIIETHGADALRFTLTHMATETQAARLPVQLICPHCRKLLPNPESRDEVVNCPHCAGRMTRPMGTATPTDDAPLATATSERFDVGRNFCNKIWNAARFALSNLASIPRPAQALSPGNLPLADRWILSRLMRTVREVDAALEEYRFDVYARTCYDFFWRDLCDWYVEAVKPSLKSGRRSETAAILAACLDVSLRLMHPMIPFITEIIWWNLSEVWPQRGLPGIIDLPPSRRLALAAWPVVNAQLIDDRVETAFAVVQELITAIRNVRNDYKVDPRRKVAVSVAAGGDMARRIADNAALIELLAVCEIRNVAAEIKVPDNCARAMVGGCEVFVEGLVDAAAEAQRLARRREELARLIAALRGRLSNEAYVSRAPAHLVQQTRQQLADAEAELARLS